MNTNKNIMKIPWKYVAFAAAIIKSLIRVPPPNFFLKLAYKCLKHNLCSSLSNHSSKIGINPWMNIKNKNISTHSKTKHKYKLVSKHNHFNTFCWFDIKTYLMSVPISLSINVKNHLQASLVSFSTTPKVNG